MRRTLGVLLGLCLVGVAVWLGWRASARRSPVKAGAAAPVASEPRRRTAPLPSIRLTDARVESAQAGGELAGKVVSILDGQAVARATLTFFHAGAAHVTESDAKGGFRFLAPEPGRYELASAIADGFLPFQPELGQSPLAFDARPGVRVSGVTLYLQPRVDYQGHVVGSDGKPVANAEVRVVDPAGDEHWTSDAKGDFTFHAGDWAMLEARLGEVRGRAMLDLAAQSSHELTIKLTLAVDKVEPISGRVVDERGGPIDGALVTAGCNGPRPEARTTTSPDGRFELRGLDDCTYRVRAQSRALTPARADGIRPGTRDLVLTLRPGGILRGRVVDSSGRAVPAFTVMAEKRRGGLERGDGVTQSFFDGEGRFEILGLEPGGYGIHAAANGQAPSSERAVEVPAPPAAAEIEIALSKGGKVSGVVVDRTSRAPLAGARVSVEGGFDADQTIAQLSSSTTTGADGHFTLGGVAPGLHSLVVAAEAHNARILSGLSLDSSSDGEIGPLTIDLAPTPPGQAPATEMVGIGAVLSAEGDVMSIVRVVAGGGAAEVGLQAGDAILAVDGTPVVDLGFGGSVQRIRGPEGSTVELTVRKKDGSTGPVTVTRRQMSGS